MCYSGSPPRMWGQSDVQDPRPFKTRFTPTHVGTIQCLVDGDRRGGFTPTHVGTIGPPSLDLSGQTVHPHACGDNPGSVATTRAVAGSPPRMWGQWVSPQRLASPTRFTPTHVGTMWSSVSMGYFLLVHPHACGDNFAEYWSNQVSDGSPPRMWGQYNDLAAHGRKVWFTPTHVGTIHGNNRKTPIFAVHPHACGDNGAIQLIVARRCGSPPRMWGQ